MNAIVFIGTYKSGSSREAIKAAKKLGYFTFLITDSTKQIKQRLEYDEVDCMLYCKFDFNKILKKIKDIQTKSIEIVSILSFIDPFCETACLLAERLGLNHFTLEAIQMMQSKSHSRNCLKDTPYIPKFLTTQKNEKLTEDQIKKLLPAVLKYPRSQGSKDVYFINDYTNYLEHYSLLMNKYKCAPMIVEEFLDGPQYLVEILVIHSHIHIIAIIEQEVQYINNHYIITGYNLLINPSELFYFNLECAITEIINHHGLKHGPCHLELRYVKEQWKLIEINPRISGAGMNTLLEIGLGINLVEETIKLALNEEVNSIPKFKIHTYAHYLIASKTGKLEKVTGRTRALNCKGVNYVHVKAKKGNLLTPPESMGNRYAYVIATGETEEEAKENAKYAASKIQFHIKDLD